MSSLIRRLFHRFISRRAFERVAVNLPVVVHTNNAIQNLTITNWTPGGGFVPMSEPLPMDTLAQLVFFLGNDGDTQVHLKGQVVRHQTQGVSGVGIMFVDLTESGLNMLRDFLTSEMKRSKSS